MLYVFKPTFQDMCTHQLPSACLISVLQGGIVRSWFDDRVEVRNALSKLNYLNQLTRLSRKKLPWGKALEEMDGLIDPPKQSTKQIGSTSADASAAAV
jgi:hypothetical protein